MDPWNEDDEKDPINPKLILYLFIGLFAILFISGLVIMVPWLSYQKNTDWGAILIDNAIILIIAGVFFFGILMATKMR